MFLKQLDIIGFKSFAERIAIEFVPGVTAVVGPNGSGKSNITDAIRWVLGEQSARSLRGGRMEDVIFAGSDSRKQLNFAEVTITLDNEKQTLPIEYNEVSVTRRVYRLGDSEFFLNNQPCRLKDIIDLFMDSGLGKEAFSIISQGKVDEILNSKPEERRTIFEEAAGVLKYKNRKKTAETKLSETSENLNRVNDIIHELEGQIEPLKIQASIATDYLEKKRELKNFEVALTVHEIESHHEDWENSKAQLEKQADAELRLSSNIQIVETHLENERGRLSVLDESITNLQTVMLTVTKELEKLEGRREVLKERKRNASQNTEQLKKNIDEASEKVMQIEQKWFETKEEVKIKEAEVRRLKQVLKTKRHQLELLDGAIEDTIESKKSDYIDLLNEQASANNEVQYLDQQQNQLKARSTRLDGENEKYIGQRLEITVEIKEKEAELLQVERQIAAQIDQFNKVEKNISSLKKQFAEQEMLYQQAIQFVQKARSRKETLEEMEEEYTGFFQGVREVLKARATTLEGIKGAVAELLHVPKEFEVALETALGGSMQNIVVKTEEHGRKAIEFLKNNQYGRATFLPLNVLKPKSFQPNQEAALASHPSFVGIASNLITYDPIYMPVVSNLLGHIIVAKDLSGANSLAKLLNYRYRIVTMDGDVVNPGGSMTGGATRRKTSSLLGRKSELEELKTKLHTMEATTAKLDQRVKDLRTSIVNEENSLDGIRQKGEGLRLQQNDVESTIVQIEMRKKNVDERLALYDLEKSELTYERKKIEDRMGILTSNLVHSEKRIESLKREIDTLTAQRNSERLSKELLSGEVSDNASLYAVTNEQLSTSKSHLDGLTVELAESNARKESLVDDLHWLENEMTGHYSTEEGIAAEAEKKKVDKSETTKLISQRREERYHVQQSIEDKELELKELKRQHKGFAGYLRDLEVKINRLDVELENRLNKLREEYILSFEGAKENFSLSIPIEEAKEKVKLIKLGISELGVVNTGAIEEYDRIYERYNFLSEQQSDLTEAKATLFEIMNEMDHEMEKRFNHTFQAIQNEFEGVFKALFGGGRAELKLTNPEDLLNTGIDIVAQPPGKKLQNLSLLSGGERSLTAIALLFSILKIRPVPFCILDEVEAALDEANVHRFSRYLRKFSEDTQFIVITHRQGTMQGADVLYGVTMQESGVSKLVSVKLENEKELQQTI